LDYQRFLHQLAQHDAGWESLAAQPNTDKFEKILQQVGSKTTPQIMQLLSSAIDCLEPNEVYCSIDSEVANLLAALVDRPEVMAYAIAPVSDDADDLAIEKSAEQFIENLSEFEIADRVFFSQQNVEDFWIELRELNPDERIGVYFYNGDHDYRSHLMALLLAKPFLAEKALIILSQSHLATVQQANRDFLTAHPECQPLLDFSEAPSSDQSIDQWQGLQILSWDASRLSSPNIIPRPEPKDALIVQSLQASSRRIDANKIRWETTQNRNVPVIQALLENTAPIQLELGAGGRRITGWTAIDHQGDCDLCLDLSQPLPFPDRSVKQIYSSHVFEHFSYPHPMQDLLAECYRVLQPGGYFKIAVPDAAIYLNGYAGSKDFDPEKFCLYKPAYHYHSKIDFVNYIAYMAGHHRHLFDADNLVAILSEVGFQQVRLTEFDRTLDIEERHYESIYAEGTK
jgi:predicted SAM-dependent methyltransferase